MAQGGLEAAADRGQFPGTDAAMSPGPQLKVIRQPGRRLTDEGDHHIGIPEEDKVDMQNLGDYPSSRPRSLTAGP